MTYEFIIRIFVAAVLGGLIGLEREYRAKEAGFRTHFLVALGSSLFMILSQYGFDTPLTILQKNVFRPITNSISSSHRHRIYRRRNNNIPEKRDTRPHHSCRLMGDIRHRPYMWSRTIHISLSHNHPCTAMS